MNRSGVADLIGDSCLWRGLSPRNRSHLLIFGACAAGFLAVGTVQVLDGRRPAEAGAAALNAAVMLFLCWAIARELDPDHPQSAFVGTAVGALILVMGSAPAGPSVGVLLALRVVVRTTGKRPSDLDLLSIISLAAAFAWLPHGWIGGAAMAAALVWDTLLPEPGRRRGLVAAAAALAAAAAVSLYRETFDAGFRSSGVGAWVVLGAALAGFAALKHYVPRSRCDRSRNTVDAARLRSGRMLVLGTGLVAFAAFGTGAVALLVSVWAALAGIAFSDRILRFKPSPAL